MTVSSLNVVMICCPSRSGSTMIDLTLGNTRDSFSTGELYCLFRTFKRSHHKFLRSTSYKARFWKDLKRQCKSPADIYPKIQQRSGSSWVIDSSKELGWVIPMNQSLRQRGIQVKSVLIYKNPIDLYWSYKKRGDGLKRLKIAMDYYRCLLNFEQEHVVMSLDDFLRQPALATEKLSKSLGMPLVENQHEFWNKSHLHLFGSPTVEKILQSGRPSIYTPDLEKREALREEVRPLLELPEYERLYSFLNSKNILSENESLDLTSTYQDTLNCVMRRKMALFVKGTLSRIGVYLYD